METARPSAELGYTGYETPDAGEATRDGEGKGVWVYGDGRHGGEEGG